MLLRPVGIVDAVIDRSVHRLKRDLLRYASGDYLPRRLAHRQLGRFHLQVPDTCKQPITTRPFTIPTLGEGDETASLN